MNFILFLFALGFPFFFFFLIIYFLISNSNNNYPFFFFFLEYYCTYNEIKINFYLLRRLI